MKKALVYGLGENYRHSKDFLEKNFYIVGYIDRNLTGEAPSLSLISAYIYDVIIVTPSDSSPIVTYLLDIGVEKHKIIVLKELLIENVFSQSYEKRALISYIISPFIFGGDFKKHTNHMECLTAARIFDSLGYIVDVVNCDADVQIDYSGYDVVYGMADNLERSFEYEEGMIRIFYATGCNPIYSNVETLKRSREFIKHGRGFAFSSTRFIEGNQEKQIFLSDQVIVLGNEFVESTYTRFDDNNSSWRYSRLNAFFYNNENINVQDKNYSDARSHFVWFGSSGCLHKGLDLAIQLALDHPEYTLHICGARHKEELEFWDYYQSFVNEADNIVEHGFLNVASKEFSDLMMKCGFAIFPSVSEGGCPALLTVMGNGGLIPLTSVRTGLDLPEFIPVLRQEQNSLQEYEKLIEYWSTFSDNHLREISIALKEYVCKNYTYESYKYCLEQIIRKVLSSYEEETDDSCQSGTTFL